MQSYLWKRRGRVTFLDVPVWIQLRQVPVIHVLQSLLGRTAATRSLLEKENPVVGGNTNIIYASFPGRLNNQPAGWSEPGSPVSKPASLSSAAEQAEPGTPLSRTSAAPAGRPGK